MNAEENKDFIDLGSDPVDDEFDPFASDGDLDGVPADTSDTEQAEESAGIPTSGNPLENAIGKAEGKAAEKAKAGLLEKMPVFEYAGASEEIADASKTFDELRVEKSEDFPELSDGKRVSWTVEYGKITRSVPNPKATSISKIKYEIESSKEFLEALKKAKDKNPACKVKPRVTAQSKGIAGYKGIFRSLEEADASDKHIRIVPARDGNVYEMRCTEAGRFIARTNNIAELSEVSAGYIPAYPPVPFALFSQVLAFFRHHMRDSRETEVMAYIYWDKEEQRHVIRVPMQTASKAHISVVVPTDEDIDSGRYVHIADIHSHNSMPAFFSSTDDRDEQATRVYIAVGLLNKENLAINSRISVGGKFVKIDIRQVVDIPSILPDNGARPTFYDCQYFTFNGKADFPQECLNKVNVADNFSSSFSGKRGMDIPTVNLSPSGAQVLHSRTWLGWLRGFRLRKGA